MTQKGKIFLLIIALLFVSREAFARSLVSFRWVGGVTSHSAVIKAKTTSDNTSIRLLVSKNSNLADSWISTEKQSFSEVNSGVVRFDVPDLKPNVTYHYGFKVNGIIETDKTGKFRTFPDGPSGFTIAFGSCAETGSNHPVFETIQKADPLLFIHMGDIHYSDIDEDELRLYSMGYEKVLRSPRQSSLYANVPIAYIWDDHDYGPNNSDASTYGKREARRAYDDYVPHYPLIDSDDNGAIYQAFTIGRVRFILTDLRSQKTPYQELDNKDKTILGKKQKEWLKKELLEGKKKYPLIVWVSTIPWIGLPWNDKYDSKKGDAWNRYATERREIANFIEEEGITNLAMLSGDAHMLAIDDGSNSNYSDRGERGTGFPVMNAAALDRYGSVKGGPYSNGAIGGRGQFGLMTVTDNGGDEIEVKWSGKNYENRELIRYSFKSGTGEQRLSGGERKRFNLVEKLERIFIPWGK